MELTPGLRCGIIAVLLCIAGSAFTVIGLTSHWDWAFELGRGAIVIGGLFALAGVLFMFKEWPGPEQQTLEP